MSEIRNTHAALLRYHDLMNVSNHALCMTEEDVDKTGEHIVDGAMVPVWSYMADTREPKIAYSLGLNGPDRPPPPPRKRWRVSAPPLPLVGRVCRPIGPA